LNGEVLKNLDEINGQITKVSEVTSEIAAASDQQNQGIEQVNTAVEQMNLVTQNVAANAEESASAAEELSGQANELQSMVNQFQLRVTGESGNVVSKAIARGKIPAPATKTKTAALVHMPKVAVGNLRQSARHLIPFDEKSHCSLSDF
jgi:uncharacterized phage infection (PIP) family protein YhgE